MVQQEKELIPCPEAVSKEAKTAVGRRGCPVLTVEIDRASIRVHWAALAESANTPFTKGFRQFRLIKRGAKVVCSCASPRVPPPV